MSSIRLAIDPHPLLDAVAFATSFPEALGSLETPPPILDLLRADSAAPMSSDDGCRKAVRDLLRHGGYKPTGRGKPASEYLIGAAAEGRLAPINPAVDACNAVSLHSGLPITVVDLDLAREPLRVAIAPEGASYVFNAAGQEIDLAGLLCLFDASGPCGNAVKDSQRTKTRPETTRTLSIVWGTSALPGRAAAAVTWYRRLLEEAGAVTEAVG